jgi:regulatory protein
LLKISTIYNSAIRYLARREYSVKELVDKLVLKGFELSAIHETIARLQVENLQSESRFVEMLIRSRISQGKGPVRIIHELEEHHIPFNQIKTALETAEVCWFALASKVRAQRFGDSFPDNYPEKAKQMRFLQYRGFEMEQIRAALKVSKWG